MKKTLLPIRIVFVTVCVASGWLVCYVGDEMNAKRGLGALIGLLLGVLVVLVDILLKGFSLRG
ncbi:MAG TPA: twitching motility protein PilT, partial [Opitutaceae bacterium]|nr:twitching motility protein PilT [Opitutaceae bacterium]